MKRTASANWKGSGKEGKGVLSAPSGIFKEQPYTSGSRFEQDPGTNPEELIAAAHAGCFSMKLAFILNAAGFTPDSIDTNCTVNLEGGKIIESHLDVKAKVPGMDDAKVQECARDAKENCPISKSLNTEITMDAQLTT